MLITKTMKALSSYPNMTSKNFEELPSILGTAITFQTVSYVEGEYNASAFRDLHAFLRKSKKPF